jgi:hypothetical protein
MDIFQNIKNIVNEALKRIITLQTKRTYQQELQYITQTLYDAQREEIKAILDLYALEKEYYKNQQMIEAPNVTESEKLLWKAIETVAKKYNKEIKG